MNRSRNSKPIALPIRHLAVCFATAGFAALLAGCGSGPGISGTLSGAGSPVPLRVSGRVHGGQQPVAGATIQLYTVGTSGPKSASSPLIASTVLTAADGSFNINPPLYNCTSATEVYITATGGDPGSGPNSALTEAAALGPCSGLTPATFIQVNELTTVAAAYALSPFAADITHIGAAGSFPTGLVGAFANASLIASTTTGAATTGLGAGVTVPVAEINTLGDILAACVNTTGPASGPCTTLFNATGATETFGAALAIARTPGKPAITALYTLPTAAAPFQPMLSSNSAPNDYAIAITTTANGSLFTPYGIALDASGNAWVTNESGTALTEISPAGAKLASPTAAGLIGAQADAFDRSGNLWVANTAGNSVVKFTLTAGAVTSSANFTAGGITAPVAIALDSAGNAFIANFNSNSVTGLNSAGTPLAGSPFTGSNNNIIEPSGAAVASDGSVYVTSGTGSVVKLSNSGTFVTTLSDSTLQGPVGVAVDSSGRVIATGFTTGSAVGGAVSEFSAAGVALANSPVTTGISSPNGVASDGISIFVVNDTSGGGLAQFAYGSPDPTSPANGYGSLGSPSGVAIDATGSVWTANSGINTVSRFIGLANPVSTPLAANVGP